MKSISIPKKKLYLDAVDLAFKWVIKCKRNYAIGLVVNGDVAPEGRFNYWVCD